MGSGHIYLVPYDDRWPLMFAEAAVEIRDACGEAVTRIEHIGSTAIPECAAKPVIDLMPGLTSFEAGNGCVEAMTRRGYEYLGEFGLPRRHYFVRRASGGTLQRNVHMYPVGEGQWDAQIAFRDYLRAHDEAREAYVRLKRELALRFPDDGDAYSSAKSDFVAEILARAAGT